MDYLLCDVYFIGMEYGIFDLIRILCVIWFYKGGIVFVMNGMYVVEDYIVSCY